MFGTYSSSKTAQLDHARLRLRPRVADLSSQAEIHRLAEKLHGSLSRIDVLINNAAAMFADREVTP